MKYAFLRYAVLLFVAVALQLFVFDAVNMGACVNPMVYIIFILLLPANMKPVAVLFLGLVLGVVMDAFTGTAGIHTIATLFTAYIRRFVLDIIVGREYVDEGGIPSPGLLGNGKFMRYAVITVAAHCLVFFSFEALNLGWFHLVLLKTLLGGGITLLFVWLLSKVFTAGVRKKV